MSKFIFASVCAVLMLLNLVPSVAVANTTGFHASEAEKVFGGKFENNEIRFEMDGRKYILSQFKHSLDGRGNRLWTCRLTRKRGTFIDVLSEDWTADIHVVFEDNTAKIVTFEMTVDTGETISLRGLTSVGVAGPVTAQADPLGLAQSMVELFESRGEKAEFSTHLIHTVYRFLACCH